MAQVKIIVVDDEASIRDSLTQFFDDYDFSVSSAASAEEALVQLAQAQYDVAIIDIRLPKMDGDTLIVKAHDLQPALRFLIHTGSVDYKLSPELEMIGLRSDHVFLKPAPNLTVMIDTIKRLLAGTAGLSNGG